MNVVVLAGGFSTERDVSLSSGALIANALVENGHRVLLVDLYLGLDDATDGNFLPRFTDRPITPPAIAHQAPDLEQLKREHGSALIGKNVLEVCRQADFVFLALHGGIGENGQLQSVLEAQNVSFTGTSHLGCVLAMDKQISKILFAAAGIPVPDGICLNATDPIPEYPLPCVVKPCSGGSSVGTNMADTREELVAAVEEARKYEDRVLVETKIVGREFSVGVLEGKALPPIEIIPKTAFYNYENKYQTGATEEVCPAHLTEEETKELQALAERAAAALHMGSYCRIDFLLRASDHTFVCLESNALPGMTPNSLLPQEAAAVGISYNQLVDRICRLRNRIL